MGWALRATSLPAASLNDVSSVPWPLSSARQRTMTTRWGSRVTGGGFGAGSENMIPVRSIRVDGPGTGRTLMFSMNSADTISMTSGTYPASESAGLRRSPKVRGDGLAVVGEGDDGGHLQPAGGGGRAVGAGRGRHGDGRGPGVRCRARRGAADVD